MSDEKKKSRISGKNLLLIVGAVAGLILILLSTSQGESTPMPEISPEEEMESVKKYIDTLEIRLKGILESMDGIGNVNVIITAKEGAEDVYASDARYDGGSLTTKEYVFDKNGNLVKVKLVFPKIKGVAIVCSGGSNPINREKIVSLVTSLFDIGASNVYVCS